MKILIGFSLIILLLGCANSPSNKSNTNLINMLSHANEAYQEARLNDAETQYLAIKQSYPQYKEAWFKLGNIYARQGRLKAAIKQYETVIQLDAEDGRAWYNLAIVKVNEAKKVLTEAEQILLEDSEFIEPIQTLKQQLNALSQEQ
ncbi:tetratricopeptide repeat protein [Shewanella gaetbuli]